MPILLVLLAMLVATSAAAEPATPLETITVTAHRMPTTDSVLPVLVRAPATGPGVGADALRNLPSLAISQAGNLGSVTQVRIRGAEANHLMVLMDGVELTDPATDSSYNFANFTLSGVNHLELLAGSHSAIWGSDALAGVLNIATAPTEQIRRLDIEAGAFDTQHANLQLAERSERYYYNLSAGDFTTDGTNVSAFDQDNENDGFQQSSVLFSGGLTGDIWSVSTLLRHMTSSADFDPTPFPSFQPRDGDNVTEHDETMASLTVDWHGIDHLEQRLQVSYFETENRSYTDDRREATTAAERRKATSITRWRPGNRQAFTLLLEHEKEAFDQAGAASFFGDPNQRQAVESTSAALEYLANPTASLALTASARYDDNSDFDNSDSFRAAARYQLQDGWQLWASWGTGIKNPSFVERFGFTPDTFFGNDALKPESNRHLSAGVRYQPGTWSLAATLFRDRLKDEINGFAFDANLGGFTSVNEDGTSQRQGAELEVSADFAFASLALGVSYLNAEEPDGAREIRRPDWQGFVTVRREFGPFAAELSAFHVDDQDDFDFSRFPADRVSLDAYTLVRAHLHYQLTHRLQVALRGENLLDEDYQDQLGYNAPGRAVYLQLGVEF